MAGEFPVQAKSASRRKQWKIYRGHGGPFRRLITELAEDESPESQVMYAKQLFDDSCCEEDEQAEENARLGVYWLLRASEQGHEEATQMLHHCLITGRGITPQNIEDVKTCLNMPLDEKVSRHAAREIFASLSKGEDFITSDQLSEEMMRVEESSPGSTRPSTSSSDSMSCASTSKPPPDASLDPAPPNNWKRRLVESGKSEKLTEEMLVSAASQHCRGYLPLVHRTLSLHTTRPANSRFKRIALFPVRHLVSSYRRLIDSIGVGEVSSLVVDVYVPVMLVCVYCVVGLEGLLEVMPTLLYYTSLAAMLFTSCQILSKKWESSHFRQWSNLLVAYGGDGVNPCDAQWAHCLNNLRPSFMFLLALLVNLLCIPFVAPHSLPHSELVLISILCSFILLYNFMWNKGKVDLLMVVSFGTHVFARYPYDADPVVYQGWRFIDVHVPTFSSYIMSNGIEFCLHFRLILYLLLVMLMVKMSSRDNWRGFFSTLVPHVVCLSWWQMAVISSNGATWYGLIRACLGLFGVVLFLPLAGLSTVLIPGAAILRSLISLYYMPLPVSVALSAAAFISAAYLSYKYRSAFPYHGLTWIQVLVILLSVGILAAFSGESESVDSPVADRATLSYPQYLSLCPQPGGGPADLRAISDTRCLLTQGLLVSWEGSVLSTRVSNLHNPISSILSRLPPSLQETVTCLYGERFERECPGDKNTCPALPSALINKCHLSNWNRYEFEIEVSVSGGSSSAGGGMWGSGGEEATDRALLVAHHSFKNLTLSLTRGDKLWFSGRLTYSKERDVRRPTVVLFAAGCVACSKETTPTSSHSVQSDLSLVMSASLNSMLHFLLSPLYSFKPV